MSSTSKSVFRNPLINGWPLFWLITLPMLGFMAAAILSHDLGDPSDVSELIGYSVRWAVPFIFWVVAASAVPVLFPSDFTRWWSRNRRYTGLVFAVAMGFQGLFIFVISGLYTDYYYAEIYTLRDELEGTSGYVFLFAMVFTSFEFGRRLITPAQWKVLHRCGVYFLWAYPFSVYWWNLFYYPYQGTGYTNAYYDYVFYVLGLSAFAFRIAAWGKRRAMLNNRSVQPAVSTLARGAGGVLVAIGTVAAFTGQYWFPTVTGFFYADFWPPGIVAMQLWMPFWPLEPFMPLIAMGIGTWLYTGGFREASQAAPTTAAVGA